MLGTKEYRWRDAGRSVVKAALGTVLMGAVGLAGESVCAEDWPNFRGPRHDGVSTERGLRVSGDQPLKLLWEAELGSAFSSMAVVGGRVYTCGAADGQQVLYCLDADNGRVIWQTAIEKNYENSHGSGTRATPSVRDGLVYILGAHGRLLCADAKTGVPVWSHSFHNPPTWGYAGSVLIQDDLAIATAGHQEGTLVAMDRRTGALRWRCGTDAAGYATPYPFTFQGKPYLVGFSGESALLAEATTGRLALRIPWSTSWQVNAAAPIVHDGNLFLSSGYQTGCSVFRLGTEGQELTATPVWKNRVLRNKFQSCIYHDGFLYASDQRGLKCVAFLTGREAWQIPRLKHGTVVLAQDHLYFLTEQGELQIGAASPDGFKPELTANLLSGRCWSVSVISNGRLFMRNLQRAVCFDLRK